MSSNAAHSKYDTKVKTLVITGILSALAHLLLLLPGEKTGTEKFLAIKPCIGKALILRMMVILKGAKHFLRGSEYPQFPLELMGNLQHFIVFQHDCELDNVMLANT